MTRTKLIVEQEDDASVQQIVQALDSLAHKMRARGTPDVDGPLVDGTGRVIAEVRVVHS